MADQATLAGPGFERQHRDTGEGERPAVAHLEGQHGEGVGGRPPAAHAEGAGERSGEQRRPDAAKGLDQPARQAKDGYFDRRLAEIGGDRGEVPVRAGPGAITAAGEAVRARRDRARSRLEGEREADDHAARMQPLRAHDRGEVRRYPAKDQARSRGDTRLLEVDKAPREAWVG